MSPIDNTPLGITIELKPFHADLCHCPVLAEAAGNPLALVELARKGPRPSDLLTAASLHLNAYLKRSLFLEFNVSSSPMLRELCRAPIGMEAGSIAVPQGPGLGVEVIEEVLPQYLKKK